MNKYLLTILDKYKNIIKMNNQTDESFDLIVLDDNFYFKLIDSFGEAYTKQNLGNVAWELKNRAGSFKVYQNSEIVNKRKNINPFTKKVHGYVISFSCENVSYYTQNVADIGRQVERSRKIWKEFASFGRALKLSIIKFNLLIN